MSFYGAKWYSAKRYPSPAHDTIIEPFAGSAGYSVRHYAKNVSLCDVDENVVSTWRYLIGASSSEIASLPLLRPGQSVDDLLIIDEARILIGWWVNKGCAQPRKTLSAWAKDPRYSGQFWGERIRHRLSIQVEMIKHWTVTLGSYADLPNVRATYFVDPPYSSQAGRHYTHSRIDYGHLGEWCTSRDGQVIVCEADGASWLPFKDLGEMRGTHGRARRGTSSEVVWINDEGEDFL